MHVRSRSFSSLSPAALLTALALSVVPTTIAAQEGTGGGGGAPVSIEGSIPASIIAAPGLIPLHLHLRGSFPAVGYQIVSRMVAWANGPDYACRLAWTDEVISQVLNSSGQPWLSGEDLVDREANEENRACGTIDGLWTDRLEVTLRDARLASPGTLQIGLGWYEGVDRDESGGLVHQGTPIESWVSVPIRAPMKVVGRTPGTPVLTNERALHITFAIQGSPPTGAALLSGDGPRDLTLRLRGGAAEVVLPTEDLAAPARVRIRLWNADSEAVATIPICVAVPGQSVSCPAGSPD